MLADDTVAVDLLYLAVGVGDDPVAAHQASRDIAVIGNRNRVAENVAVGFRLRLIIDIGSVDPNPYVAEFVFHAVILTAFFATAARNSLLMLACSRKLAWLVVMY